MGLGIAAALLAGGSIASGILSGKKAGKARKKAREFERQLAALEANRQDIINPYSEVTNPFSNLQVATGAARFQAEEQDISLANTLDLLRSTGTSAGGATALAQAALRGKQDISNSIEQQEARNQQLAAEGQARQEQLLAQGRAFAFIAQEDRENQQLNRLAGLGQEQRRLQANYNQQLIGTIAGGLSSGAQLAAGFGAGRNI